MEWTDESITRLRGFWQEGLSTAEIGRRMQITKNAVVGKAHRLTLPPRPSPIRKGPQRGGHDTAPIAADLSGPAPGTAQRPRLLPAAHDDAEVPLPHPMAPPMTAVGVPSRPPLSVVGGTRQEMSPPADAHQTPAPVEAKQAPPPAVARQAPPAEPEPPALHSVPPTPRRRGLTCCWPLGDPGTKEFHFCGGDPIAGKPYCAQHAALAYVRIRDRRESVA